MSVAIEGTDAPRRFPALNGADASDGFQTQALRQLWRVRIKETLSYIDYPTIPSTLVPSAFVHVAAHCRRQRGHHRGRCGCVYPNGGCQVPLENQSSAPWIQSSSTKGEKKQSLLSRLPRRKGLGWEDATHERRGKAKRTGESS